MKKQIALAMGLAVVSGSAFATKARLEALGEDQYGSQFISDNRNIFLNPATVNFHKDMVTYEWGTPTVAADSAATPSSEGGFLKASGNMVYGLHFGSESNTSHQYRMASGVNLMEENAIDIFVGGDAGVQWGASLTYSSTEDEGSDEEQSAMRARLGAVSGNVSGFANINLGNKAEDGTNEFEGNTGFDLGATYEMNDMYYMARYRTLAGERKDGEEISGTKTWIGAAKAYKMNDRSNVWLSGWYKMETTDVFGTETKMNFLPVTVATEVKVKDWLMLRGSVGHTLIGTSEADNGDKSSITTASVNAGASVVFGDFQVDGLIGNNDNTGVAGNDTSANGTLRGDTLLSRVSMTYKF